MSSLNVEVLCEDGQARGFNALLQVAGLPACTDMNNVPVTLPDIPIQVASVRNLSAARVLTMPPNAQPGWTVDVISDATTAANADGGFAITVTANTSVNAQTIEGGASLSLIELHATGTGGCVGARFALAADGLTWRRVAVFAGK
jgi:hypothetical protein